MVGFPCRKKTTQLQYLTEIGMEEQSTGYKDILKRGEDTVNTIEAGATMKSITIESGDYNLTHEILEGN